VTAPTSISSPAAHHHHQPVAARPVDQAVLVVRVEERARGVAAQNGLHTERFTHRTVYTHAERFTRRTVYTHSVTVPTLASDSFQPSSWCPCALHSTANAENDSCVWHVRPPRLMSGVAEGEEVALSEEGTWSSLMGDGTLPGPGDPSKPQADPLLALPSTASLLKSM
jgi:hypothetical protein